MDNGDKIDVFLKLERLERHLLSRIKLCGMLSNCKDHMSRSAERFETAKKEFDQLIENPQNKPRIVNRSNEDPPKYTKTVRPSIAPVPSSGNVGNANKLPLPDHKVVDATNLCLIFKAFQPFLDRNIPHEVAVQILESIKHPKPQPEVFRQFLGSQDQLNKGPNSVKTRPRRRVLMLHQYRETIPDGGVKGVKLKIAGHTGGINPAAFGSVLLYLTEGKALPTMIRALFSHFDEKDKSRDESVDLNAFLDLVDDVVYDKKHQVINTCFKLACGSDSTVLARGDLYNEVVPSGRLTANQAQCLLDHFPPENRPPRLPTSRRKRDPAYQMLEVKNTSAALRNFHVGPTMDRRQFGAAFEESPYLVICFLDCLLRFVANELSQQYKQQERKHPTTKLELLGPIW